MWSIVFLDSVGGGEAGARTGENLPLNERLDENPTIYNERNLE